LYIIYSDFHVSKRLLSFLWVSHSDRASESSHDIVSVGSDLITGVERIGEHAQLFEPLLLSSNPINNFDSELSASLANTIESIVSLRDNRDRGSTRDVIPRPSGRDGVVCRINLELLYTQSSSSKEEGATLRSFSRQIVSDGIFLVNLAHDTHVLVIKPIVHNHCLVS